MHVLGRAGGVPVRAALLSLCALLCALAAPQSPGQASYERANTLFVAKKFPEALVAVEEALRLDANLVPALTLKAKLAMAANRHDIARTSLEHALSVDPKAFYAQFLYGMEAYLNNEMKEALLRFRRARELAPKDPRAALYLALSTESVGQPEEALALYQEAAALGRASGQLDGEALLPGARLLLLMGRLEECDRWLREAVKLSPKLRDAHFERARLLLKKGQAREAAESGESALQLQGTIGDTAIHYFLIRAWQKAGAPERGATHAAVIRAQEK